jgi:transcription initiation factor TFIIE subunit alpha
MRFELLRDVIYSIIGEKSKGIVELLAENKNVNEFIIAKKLSLNINQTRNLLYKLLEEGLVSVARKKNKKKGGWYDHFWTLNLEKSITKFKDNLTKKIDSLNQQIKNRKNARYYFCETCGTEYSEEDALAHQYACPECGTLLSLRDNAKSVAGLEKELAKLEKVLLEVNQEHSQLMAKSQKLKEKRLRAEERKKKKERDAKKRARNKMRSKVRGKKKKSKESARFTKKR